MIAPISSARGTTVLHPTNADAGAITTLPPTQTDGVEDALTELYAVMTKLSDAEFTNEQAGCKNAQTDHDLATQRRNAELARAKRESEKGGLFKRLTKDIGVAGLAGLCTFNYALVAGDIASHETGLAKNMKLDVADGLAATALQTRPELLLADLLVRKLDLAPDALRKKVNDALGPLLNAGVSDKDVQPLVDKAVQINLLVAGAAASVLTAGTTAALVVALIAVAMSAGAFASEQAGGPEWLSLGLSLGSGALTLGAGMAGGGASVLTNSAAVKSGAEAAAAVVNGVNGTIGGVDMVVNAAHQRIEDDANTKAQDALFAMQKLERTFDDLLDALQQTQQAKKQTSSAIQNAIQIHDQTNLAISSAVKA